MKEPTLSQWSIIKKDKWLLISLTLLPLLLSLSLWWIFSQSMARNLPIAVIDLQKSSLSRQLTRHLDATDILKVVGSYADIASAKRAFIGNKIYAYMVIPKNFDRDIYLNTPPQVSMFYNSQFILVGKLINKAVAQAHGTFDAQVAVMKQLSMGNKTTSSALGKALTIRTQITPLFNKNSNYAQFLVSGIVPAIWQISIVVSTILLLAANFRIYGQSTVFYKTPFKNILKINAFYFPFFLIQGFAFLLWFYQILDWPMMGSLFVLFIAQVVTALACVIMGSLFFLISFDPARAMSFAAAFTAPSFAFMGVTFPASDMNVLAKSWRNLLPISHYIEAQISQVSYGVSAWNTLSNFIPTMFFYFIPLLLTFLLIKKQLKKMDLHHDVI